MKKLLIATDNFLPRYDGIARFLKEVLPVFTEMYEVTVVCPNYGPVELPGVRIIQVPLSKWRVGDYQIPQFQGKLMRKLVSENDIVFCQGIGPIGWSAIRAANKQRKKLVLFTHSIDWELVPRAMGDSIWNHILPDVSKWFVRRQYSKCNLLLVPSESVSEVLHWNKIDTKQQVVHLGVNTKEFVPAKDKTAAKEKLGIAKDKLVIGYHGRLAPEKDLKTLLRGFLRVRGAQLLIVGTGTEEIERSLKRKDVILAGGRDNVVPYLQAMDIYVLTSLTETTSLSVLEAMSCGLPVISTPVGFVNDYITTNENGIIIPKQNPYALSKELEKVLHSQLLRDKLGLAARKTVEKDFTWDKTRKRIKEIFEDL